MLLFALVVGLGPAVQLISRPSLALAALTGAGILVGALFGYVASEFNRGSSS